METIGINLMVWLESLFKRLIDAIAGRGGIEALCQYLDQIDFIPQLLPLRQKIKMNSIFFETALSKCSKELLKRPVQIRQQEIFEFLGSQCQKCSFNTSLWMMMELGGRCPRCNEPLKPLYATTLTELVKRKIGLSPEAIMMFVAYDRLAEAYVEAYKALRLVMDKTAEILGWEKFHIRNPELRNYMDEYFMGRLAGEQKIPREEKQLLQFLVRGSLTDVSVEDGEKLIRSGMDVVKYGYLYEVLGATGAHTYYEEALAKYSLLYNRLNEQIRIVMAELYAEKKRQIVRMPRILGGYVACLKMPRKTWTAGQLAEEITLEPLFRLPIFPKADFGALQVCYGRLGSGKTFLLSSIVSYAVLKKKELVFSPLNDKTNTFTLACIPLFAYNKRTERLLHLLKEVLGVEPVGIPTLTLNILRRGEKITDKSRNPPTIFDRIIQVENAKSFTIDFKQVMEELKETAESYGYSKPAGLINIRNLDRFDAAANENIDVQAASNALTQFDRWRKSHLSQPARVTVDEVSYLASAQVGLYSGDAWRSAATISDFIKESRRNRLSIDVATQLPVEIIPDIRNAATNIFFRDLAVSKDKSRSQIDFLLESMQLEDSTLKGVVRELNNRGAIPKGYWFWYHQPTRTIELVKPCPPVFTLPDIRLTPMEIIRKYERTARQKILLESWSQVKTLSSAEKVESARNIRIR